MKKSLVAIGLAVSMMAALVGCGGKDVSVSNDKITIKQYKGLEVEKVEAIAVTDADVEASIKSTLQTQATQTEVKDRAAQNGDVVTIDYVGKKDGVAFDGGTADDYDLELGSNSFIDGFEAGIVGHKVGETFDLDLTFPKEYHSEDLAGQAVVFTVTLDAIKEVTLPELNEEFIKGLTGTEMTVEEYKKQVREDLEYSNQQSADSQFQQKVWGALLENCEVKEYPQDILDEQISQIQNQYAYYAYMSGVEVDAFVEQYYGVSIERMAKDQICQMYAIELIAETEGITITAEDYENGLKSYAEQYGYDDLAEFEELIGEENLKTALLQERVEKVLLDNCKKVDKK